MVYVMSNKEIVLLGSNEKYYFAKERNSGNVAKRYVMDTCASLLRISVV